MNLQSNLITRLNEYRTCEDSEVSKHLLNNPNHEINFDSPKILDRSNHVTKLRFRETLHISKTESRLNVDNQSLPLYLFMLSYFNCCFKLTSLFACVFLCI